MEPAGLALGAVAGIKLLLRVAESGREFCKSVKHFGEETDSAALRMNIEFDRTVALHDLLFGDDKTGNEVVMEPDHGRRRRPLMEIMNDKTQSDVLLISLQFQRIMEYRFNEIHDVLAATQPAPSPSSHHSAAPLTQRRLSGRKRLTWALWGRKNISMVIDEYETWNERLFGIVQLHCLSYHMPDLKADSGSQASQPRIADRDRHLELLGLDNELQLAEISSDVGQKQPALEISRNDVTLDIVCGRLQCGVMNGRDIVIDFKSFIPLPNKTEDEVLDEPTANSKQRIIQLGNLLHSPKSTRFRALSSRGFFRDASSPRYGFVFDVPPGRARMPSSLQDCLKNTSESASGTSRPSLERRYSLALKLAIAVGQFHAVGWVHKSIRSDNVVFFPPLISEDGTDGLEQPHIFGFEYAREHDGLSENPNNDIDVQEEVYKHPDQWGQPTRRFHQIHDLYSMGVVLLEIGLWKPVVSLERDEFKRASFDERLEVQKHFIRQAKEKLPFFTGSSFARVVETCLAGAFEIDQEDSHQGNTTLQVLYQSHILDILRQLSQSCRGQSLHFMS